jgi:hypothetical protein
MAKYPRPGARRTPERKPSRSTMTARSASLSVRVPSRVGAEHHNATNHGFEARSLLSWPCRTTAVRTALRSAFVARRCAKAAAGINAPATTSNTRTRESFTTAKLYQLQRRGPTSPGPAFTEIQGGRDGMQSRSAAYAERPLCLRRLYRRARKLRPRRSDCRVCRSGRGRLNF